MRTFFHSPYVCLVLVIGLLASVTPVIKAVFTMDQVDPITVATLRTIIPFAVLFPIAACRNSGALMRLNRRDLKELSALGVLGIGSYLVAATGLSYTTVTHYILIYSLLPGCTAILMAIVKHRCLTTLTITGIALSFLGCLIAVSTTGLQETGSTGVVGDALVLLFTIMLALHLVASRQITKRVGTLTAHTVMFGSTSLVMMGAAWSNSEPGHAALSLSAWIGLGYIGLATTAVFLLRAHALKTLPPTTVASFHNLIPICTLVVANLWLGEPILGRTLLGAAIIVTGLEVLRRAYMKSSLEPIRGATPISSGTPGEVSVPA
jgi:drug/metabolite transporter (DMT)-like permease